MPFDAMPWLVPINQPPDDPTGLVALSRDVTPEAILVGAAHGLFPWSGRYPVPWCSPDPRALFDPAAIRVPRSLRKSLRNRGYVVTFDRTFPAVVEACAGSLRPGQSGTWLTPNLARVWLQLHQAGLYHSVEVWHEDVLVGGLVGLALGRAFFGDSMFHHARDASKVGFVHLCRSLHKAGYVLVDGQMPTPHLMSLGAQTCPRLEYLELLSTVLDASVPVGSWSDGIPSLT